MVYFGLLFECTEVVVVFVVTFVNNSRVRLQIGEHASKTTITSIHHDDDDGRRVVGRSSRREIDFKIE